MVLALPAQLTLVDLDGLAERRAAIQDGSTRCTELLEPRVDGLLAVLPGCSGLDLINGYAL